MKSLALAAALALGAAGAASATGGSAISRTHNNVTCTWRAELGGSALCQKANGTGYIIVLSQRLVMVESATFRVRFWRNQPTRSPGFEKLHDKRVTFTETHNRVSCAWTTLDGGAAFCNKASRHGYLAGLSQRHVYVSNEASKVLYFINQP